MVKIWVGVTDNNWFDFLRRIPAIDEVNFWQPSGQGNFRAVEPGSLFVFKLKAPRNVIGGFGIFSHATSCPVSLAWEAFEQKNGAATYDEMWSAIAASRAEQPQRHEDFTIGCRIVTQPVFLDELEWIEVPSNWSSNIVVGKGYDVDEPEGRRIWDQLQPYMAESGGHEFQEESTEISMIGGERFGQPALVKRRLGQGAFRLLVTDAYQRKCAVTAGKVLPALDVAHIRPYADEGEHRVSNGLLLRRDIHTLLDRGYVTIDPSLRFVVSKRVKTEFNNGEEYRKLHGKTILTPDNPRHKPDIALLDWHNRVVFQD
jgi:putative restriction endonuclease